MTARRHLSMVALLLVGCARGSPRILVGFTTEEVAEVAAVSSPVGPLVVAPERVLTNRPVPGDPTPPNYPLHLAVDPSRGYVATLSVSSGTGREDPEVREIVGEVVGGPLSTGSFSRD